MKVNSDILINSVENLYFLEDDLKSNTLFEKPFHGISSAVKPAKRLKNSNFLNQLWKKLIFNSLSFPHNPNSEISSILSEETGALAFEATNSILSKKLDLPMHSKDLLKANEDSVQIYHEDYPYDFILEYCGERLGIMILDKCFDSNGEAHLTYRFNPQIQSFRGLF